MADVMAQLLLLSRLLTGRRRNVSVGPNASQASLGATFRSVVEAARLEAAGLEAAGLEAAGLEAAWLEGGSGA